MNSPFEYVNLNLNHVDKATMDRAGSIQVEIANRMRYRPDVKSFIYSSE